MDPNAKLQRNEYKLLPGLRWRGKLAVEHVYDDGRVAVGFTAENPRSVYERYVYDNAVLTAKQFTDWTGMTTKGRKVVPATKESTP